MSEKSCDNCKHNIVFGMCEISGERAPDDEMPCDGDDCLKIKDNYDVGYCVGVTEIKKLVEDCLNVYGSD